MSSTKIQIVKKKIKKLQYCDIKDDKDCDLTV